MLSLFIGWGFTHWAQQGIENLSNEEIYDFMKKYPERIFQYVTPKREGELPTVVNFFSEPFVGAADSGYVNWITSGPYWRAFNGDGVEMLTQAYLNSILLQFLRLPSNAFCGKDIGNLSTEAHDGNPRPSTLLRLFVAL